MKYQRIFTLSPGRSGTHWISALLCMATRVPSTNHPERFKDPRGLSKVAIKEEAKRVWAELPEEDFISTSLVAKNGYLEHLGEMGARFLYLRRNFTDNALSWLRNKGTPGRTNRGHWYHPLPSSTENQIDISGFHEDLSDYQLCFWLCMEVEARAKKLSETYDVYTADLEEISNVRESTEAMLDWTKIPHDMNWWKMFKGVKIHYQMGEIEKFDERVTEGLESDLLKRLGR